MFNDKTFRWTLAALTAAAIGVAGCGASAGTGAAHPATGGEARQGGETTNGEAPAIPYVDARYHYRIDAPGRMTPNADGSAAFVGPSERIQVAVVQGAKAADVGALARDDVASLPATTTDFHLLSGPASKTINGHKGEKVTYTWSAGTSPVTGKPVKLVGVRYYIPKDQATVAVITYGIVSNQYDPQGADDIASTFRWQ